MDNMKTEGHLAFVFIQLNQAYTTRLDNYINI